MKCNCYKRAFYPVIELLEEAEGIMFYRTPDYELNLQRIHDIVLSMNTKFTCIDRCWEKEEEE
jgi:hypothetical protein